MPLNRVALVVTKTSKTEHKNITDPSKKPLLRMTIDSELISSAIRINNAP